MTLSRKKRKRNRRNKAEATAHGPKQMRGFGVGLPMRRSDCQLVAQAANEGWNVPPAIKRAAILDVYEFAEKSAEAGEYRQFLAAFRTILALAKANVLEIQREVD